MNIKGKLPIESVYLIKSVYKLRREYKRSLTARVNYVKRSICKCDQGNKIWLCKQYECSFSSPGGTPARGTPLAGVGLVFGVYQLIRLNYQVKSNTPPILAAGLNTESTLGLPTVIFQRKNRFILDIPVVAPTNWFRSGKEVVELYTILTSQPAPLFGGRASPPGGKPLWKAMLSHDVVMVMISVCTPEFKWFNLACSLYHPFTEEGWYNHWI